MNHPDEGLRSRESPVGAARSGGAGVTRRRERALPSSPLADGTAEALHVEVAVPVPLPQTFTYRWTTARHEGQSPPVPGDLVGVPFARRREVIGLVTARTPAEVTPGSSSPRPLREVRRVLAPVYRLNEDRLRLAAWLAAYYALPLGEVVPLFHPPAPGTRSRPSRREEPPFPLADSPARRLRLTAAQQEAIDAALDVLQRGAFGAILIHGITGSGKTEVYLRVIAEALARGRSAIYLLPEIALTPQTLARISSRFGLRAAAIHSGLSAGERCRVHEAAAAGEIRVVIGPRSAVFAPLSDLGVIVVDEEHETSYKQEEKPRYHARHVALMRAREAGAVVLLGSATPDLESYRNGLRNRFHLVSLRERAVGELPPVEIVDMRGQPAPEGFSPRLSACIEECLGQRRQVILFYNRRGFARAIQCCACGEAVLCPRCDIGLTYHLRPRRLLCHYCGHTEPVPTGCPHCGGQEFLPLGGGTEKVELALGASFPGVPIGRLDQDSTSRRGSHGRILSAFAQGQFKILIGTQMVAKGHHFPTVGLVGVLAADDGLTLPDYRASERVFQLLTQVAGRAGRTRPGQVVFQTYRPEDPVIQAAARHDYLAFSREELEARRILGYPPFGHLLRVALSGRRQAVTQGAACKLARAFRNGLDLSQRQILGPAPAVFERLQDRYRFQILLKGDMKVIEKKWLTECVRRLKDSERGLEASIDVDPVTLY
jgi:primosomal protein N' (replication factor Y)